MKMKILKYEISAKETPQYQMDLLQSLFNL